MSVFSQQLAVTLFQRLLDQSTDALEITVGLTGEFKLRNPRKMESLDNYTDAHFFFIVGLTDVSESVFTSSHCTDELTSGIVGSSGAGSIAPTPSF